jgi:hypothetical protein
MDFIRRVNRRMREFVSERRFLREWFRDVYPANILSQEHLAASIPGRGTLKNWGLGRLTPLEENSWLWEVPEDELVAARQALSTAGVLIC